MRDLPVLDLETDVTSRPLQTRLLRSALEWGAEMLGRDDDRAYGGAGAAFEPSESVKIMMWPPGEFKRLPRGTTAGSCFRTYVRAAEPSSEPDAACACLREHILTYAGPCGVCSACGITRFDCGCQWAHLSSGKCSSCDGEPCRVHVAACVHGTALPGLQVLVMILQHGSGRACRVSCTASVTTGSPSGTAAARW